MNYWLIIPVSLHPNTLCSVEMMELSAPPQTLVITCADSSVFVMVRTPDWFKNLRGRVRSLLHHSHPDRKGFIILIPTARVSPTTLTDRLAWRVVDKPNLWLREVSMTFFSPVGFARHKLFKLGIGDDWEDPFAGIGLETTADQDDLSWKPCSNLPPKKSQSARTSLRIAALMMLKWMICCWWLAKRWNQLEQARIVFRPLYRLSST